MSRMQAFVRLPTEFEYLLLNAAGYFDVSPKDNDVFHTRIVLLYFLSFMQK